MDEFLLVNIVVAIHVEIVHELLHHLLMIQPRISSFADCSVDQLLQLWPRQRVAFVFVELLEQTFKTKKD